MASIFIAIFDGLDLDLDYLSGIFLAYQPAMIVDQLTENTNFMTSSVSLELSHNNLSTAGISWCNNLVLR